MRHHFLRLFFSIMAIVILLLIVEVAIVIIGNYKLASDWKERVFEEFADSVEETVWKMNASDESDVFNSMVAIISERISGLLFRDGNGEFVATFGRSPAGMDLPSPENARGINPPPDIGQRLSINFQNDISYRSVLVDSPRYEIALTSSSVPSSFESVVFQPMAPSEPTEVQVPEALTDQDIAGTIVITVDGEPSAYIDVLVYRFRNYSPTAFIIEALVMLFFMIVLPLSLVISIILAAIVSKRNEKSVREIQNALNSLALGDFDITMGKQQTEEIQLIASSINRLADDLSRHQLSRKEWIRNISHDLNTPVTSLGILINGALDGVFPMDGKLLSALKKETDTLSSRIASVSYYSYILSPDIEIKPIEMDAFEITDDVLSSHRLSCTVIGENIMIYADPALITRAFLEVIMNAIIYGDSSVTPSISFHRGGDGAAVVEVRNKGTLPKPLPQFFEPWARGDASRTSGGSGLGLPIAYQIMMLHHGSISISESAGFVTVVMIFPSKT